MGYSQNAKAEDFFNGSEKVKFGVFIGANGSSVFGGNIKNVIYKMGFSGGISAVKKLEDNLHIRCDIIYINKGYKTSLIKDEDYIDKKERYYFMSDYLDFPILIQFFMPIQKYPTNWMAGLAPSIRLSTRQKTKINGKEYKSSVPDKHRLFDLNFVVGGNMMLNKHLNLDVRGSAGLIPIYKKSDFWSSRNISFIASLGYFL